MYVIIFFILLCIWERIVLIVILFVFVFSINGFEKLGCVRIGVEMSVCCNELNEFWYGLVYINFVFFFVSLFRGFVIVVKFGMKCL